MQRGKEDVGPQQDCAVAARAVHQRAVEALKMETQICAGVAGEDCRGQVPGLGFEGEAGVFEGSQIGGRFRQKGHLGRGMEEGWIWDTVIVDVARAGFVVEHLALGPRTQARIPEPPLSACGRRDSTCQRYLCPSSRNL